MVATSFEQAVLIYHRCICVYILNPILQKQKSRYPNGYLLFWVGGVIMDTSDGGNLTNAPMLRNLHPKALVCTLAQIFAPRTDKVYPKER